jgi:hypothetical protein
MKSTVTHSSRYQYNFPVVAAAAGFDRHLASLVAGWYSGGWGSQMEASLSPEADHAA